MVPISIDEFVNKKIDEKSNNNKKEIKKNILAAAKRRKNGIGCMQCNQPIWVIGSGIVGSDMCFTCITGEADDSEDYELDLVL
ncbi:hypothetical protein NC661_04905 [Aquibacillus koreensis]|uniref:Uncharacterized protein n=1 Tax=Aquibacillus koreensis TaxID=279446 RepID=A0A9X3WLX6_9BACI|nr:hypothetical protein [Aquibacillus koreensis]MCT2534686.1 hypothetical protein [Aquibacillus koreensis]MDC3419704.1 hypothetical protein [Aquibacillus koreensis]